MPYKIIMIYSNGETEERNNIFETEEDAVEYGLNLCSAYLERREILNLSNPEDYPLDDDDDVDFEIVESD